MKWTHFTAWKFQTSKTYEMSLVLLHIGMILPHRLWMCHSYAIAKMWGFPSPNHQFFGWFTYKASSYWGTVFRKTPCYNAGVFRLLKKETNTKDLFEESENYWEPILATSWGAVGAITRPNRAELIRIISIIGKVPLLPFTIYKSVIAPFME